MSTLYEVAYLDHGTWRLTVRGGEAVAQVVAQGYRAVVTVHRPGSKLYARVHDHVSAGLVLRRNWLSGVCDSLLLVGGLPRDGVEELRRRVLGPAVGTGFASDR